MYGILVVEDEPSARNHICTIVELHCPGFRIVGTADNGKEALAIIKQLKPDIVIMDIRMPVMNGLELSKELAGLYPAVYSIIVSGYQDFEYAREALKNQVFDYLLKPISPAGLYKALQAVAKRIQQDNNQKKYQLIQSITWGRNPPLEEIEGLFPEEAYMAALVRNNGLPGRFFRGTAAAVPSLGNEVMHTFGRDEMETLYLCPASAIPIDYFHTLIKRSVTKPMAGYYSLILQQQPFFPRSMAEKIQSLYQALNQGLIVGKNQVILLEDSSQPIPLSENQPPIVTAANLTEISHYLHKQDMDELKTHLAQLFSRWSQQDYPQLRLERAVKQLFYQIAMESQAFRYDSQIDTMVEDAFCYAESAAQLAENLTGISEHMLTGKSSIYYKIDTKEFFSTIETYVASSYDKPLTLDTLCRFFGISQTYISRLFRKYTGQSFNAYLTMVRMEKAKHLLEENPDMLIKDVAALVGYSNQFYFSRIFRSVTGASPSEYHRGED